MGLFKKSLGESPIPGEATLNLPAGRVRITYDEQRKGRSTEDNWGGVPPGLDITVRPAGGGEPVPIERSSSSVEFATLRRIGERYGQMKIAAAGDYKVRVAPVEGERELFDPALKFTT